MGDIRAAWPRLLPKGFLWGAVVGFLLGMVLLLTDDTDTSVGIMFLAVLMIAAGAGCLGMLAVWLLTLFGVGVETNPPPPLPQNQTFYPPTDQPGQRLPSEEPVAELHG